MRHIQRLTVMLFAVAVLLSVFTSIKLKMGEDKNIPVITSDREVLQVSVGASEEELLQGLTASDKEDGDLTDGIVVGSISKFISKGTVNVSYVVFDKNNNAGQLTRRTEFTDYVSPRFVLSAPLDYKVGEVVKVMDRLTVNDAIDGDITDKIRITSSNVNNKQEGIYTMTVQVSNDYGDTVEEKLIINVEDYKVNSPDIKLSEYMLYLNKGDSFNPGQYLVGVKDAENHDMDKELVSIQNDVNVNAAGAYQVTYSVEDENGNSANRHMMVIVKE